MFSLRNCVSVFNLVHRCQVSISSQRNIKRWVAPTLRELKNRKEKMGPELPKHRSTYLDWNYSAELFAFSKRLNEDFQTDILQTALTNRSYIAQEENRQKELGIEEPELSLEDNSQLATQGEKLISTYVKHYLRTTLPRYPEEGICTIHDHLMSDSVLASVSSNIGTKDLILSADFPVTEATLALTFKAVVAALASSSGAKQADLFIRDFVVTQLAGQDINDFWDIEEPMAVLEDILKRDGKSKPEPRLVNEAGRNTILASYQVAIYVDKEYLGIGSGESIVIATEMAAREVLRRLFKTSENMNPIPFNVTETPETKRNLSIGEWRSQNVVQCE